MADFEEIRGLPFFTSSFYFVYYVIIPFEHWSLIVLL